MKNQLYSYKNGSYCSILTGIGGLTGKWELLMASHPTVQNLANFWQFEAPLSISASPPCYGHSFQSFFEVYNFLVSLQVVLANKSANA